MKLHINRLDLLKAIQTISSGIENSSSSPIQGLAQIKVVNDKFVQFTAVNMDMGVREIIEADVEIPGDITVDIKRISEWASRCNDEDILFKKNSTTLSLKCGKSSFNLKLKDITIPEFPDILTGLTVNSNDLMEVIDDVIQASEDGSSSYRPYSNGIHVSLKDDKASATATQGTFIIYSDKASGVAGSMDTVIPRKIANDIKKLAKGSDTIVVSKTENVTAFIFGESTSLFFRNISAKLPAWRQIIPKDKSNYFVVDSEELIGSLSRTAVSLDNETRMSLIVSKDKISLSTVGNIGDNEEECPCVSSGDFDFNINWRFFSVALKNVRGNAKIVYSGSNRPLVIYRESSEESFCSIIALMV